MVQKAIEPEKARQGRWGRQVLLVLVGGLLLAMVAWFAVETYSDAPDAPPPTSQAGQT